MLDASAVLEAVLDRRARKTIAQLMPVAVIPASVLTEVCYIAADHGIPPKRIHKELAADGATFEPVTESDSLRAAHLIASSRSSNTGKRPLSLADAMCIAVAERVKLPIVGNDHHWESLKLNVAFWPIR